MLLDNHVYETYFSKCFLFNRYILTFLWQIVSIWSLYKGAIVHFKSSSGACDPQYKWINQDKYGFDKWSINDLWFTLEM